MIWKNKNIYKYIKSIIFYYKEREPLYKKMIDYSISEKINIIDIGSSDGEESKYILKKFPSISKIHLVEPDINNLSVVKKNISKKFKEKINYYNFGLSNKNYRGDFFVSNINSNLNSIIKRDESFNKITTDFVDIKSFVENNEICSPLLIMMDIEGQEVKVLEGLLPLLDKIKKMKILFEVHPPMYGENNSLEKILIKYFNKGYRTQLVESAGTPIPPKFKEHSMEPILIKGKRALYRNPQNDFILKYACHPIISPINYEPWYDKKIIRSLLISSKYS